MLNEKQIKERIYELKKEIGTLLYVLNSKNEGIGRPKGSIKYTQEEIDFLKDCEKNKLNDKEIIRLFNEKFKTNYKETTRKFYNFMCREGIRSPNYSLRKFNEEEDKFIMENIEKLNPREIAVKLEGRTRNSVKNRIRLLDDKNVE